MCLWNNFSPVLKEHRSYSPSKSIFRINYTVKSWTRIFMAFRVKPPSGRSWPSSALVALVLLYRAWISIFLSSVSGLGGVSEDRWLLTLWPRSCMTWSWVRARKIRLNPWGLRNLDNGWPTCSYPRRTWDDHDALECPLPFPMCFSVLYPFWVIKVVLEDMVDLRFVKFCWAMSWNSKSSVDPVKKVMLSHMQKM